MAQKKLKPRPSTTTHFRFATDILRRLGEELNPSPDQGLLELVKNAYDANAKECVIELIDTAIPGGTVRVVDDGDGMEHDEILNGWLVLGKSEKSTHRLTRLGRIPSGNKGLGRLAALRMGEVAELTSRPRTNSALEHHLRIDWGDFANADLVDEVPLSLTTRRRAAGAENGTEIEICQLRSGINRWDVKRLARAMILLADPFEDEPNGFSPQLVSAEFADLQQLVARRYFTEASYHLSATLNNGRSSTVVSDWQGKVLFKGQHDDISTRDADYTAPNATFAFWAFILNATTFEARKVSVAQVKEWLSTFGGVHLYHNGLRVSPYGNPGHDWLDLNFLRTRNPEERPSTNTSIGKVTVTDRNAILVQKTDRSGFIETEAFADLRNFAMDALEWMAKRRLDVAEKRRAVARTLAPKKTRQSKKKLDEIIESTQGHVKTELQEAAAAFDKSRDREVELLKKEVQLYRTLATAGITAATFAHESSGSPIKIIKVNMRSIRRRAKDSLGTEFDRLLEPPIANVERATESLGVLGTVTLNLLDHEKRRLDSKVEVHRIIERILQTFKPFFKGRDVEAIVKLCPGNPYFRGSDAAFESVVTNLLNNSLAFFEQAGTRSRRIEITTEVAEEIFVMTVSDNGPGIKGIRPRDIWLPGQSTRSGGTGLGLTIVRDTVLDFGGKVDAAETSDLGGAAIMIEIPIIGMT